tara:strand:+ start:1320 stop:1637 length:318 start_codon:yes stop_codon:yes gene_type:complete
MALRRGRDEKDFVKDLHDRARNIVAQSKDTPRIYNSQSQTTEDAFIPFQYPLNKIGLNEKDLAYYSRRQQQHISNLSSFFDTPVSVKQYENKTSKFMFDNKLLFR